MGRHRVALQGWSHIFFVLHPVDGRDVSCAVEDSWVSGLMEGQAYANVDPAEVDADIKLS
jgi:hypothetical protein